MTELYEQAQTWCKRLIIRNGAAYINHFSLDESAFERYKVLIFESYSEEWLDFIATCRSEKDRSDYDIVMGGVANIEFSTRLNCIFLAWWISSSPLNACDTKSQTRNCAFAHKACWMNACIT